MKSQKITKKDEVVRRSYDDACGAAHALDLVGERWALLVMRELFFGPKRFTDIRVALPGISANVLTQRLESLEAAGIVARRRLPPPAAVQVYDLTEWGRESEPIFQSLGRWAARSPSHDPTKPLSTASLLLSLRTMFDANRAGRLRARIGLRIGEESFRADVAEGTIIVDRGATSDADVVFTGAASAIAAAIYAGVPLTALETSGNLTIDGDRRFARKFVTLFPLPDKAPSVSA